MLIHQIKKNKNKKKKRVGRGGKRGTYSGRGMKGQKSRAGTRKMQPIIREAVKRYPKLKGYRDSRGKKAVPVNLEVLNKKFEKGEVVSPKSLIEKKIIPKIKGRAPKVKILAKGDLDKELNFEGCQVSSSAEKIIKKKGGKIS